MGYPYFSFSQSQIYSLSTIIYPLQSNTKINIRDVLNLALVTNHSMLRIGRKTDTRNSLAKLPGTFERMVRERGAWSAVRGIVELLDGEES